MTIIGSQFQGFGLLLKILVLFKKQVERQVGSGCFQKYFGALTCGSDITKDMIILTLNLKPSLNPKPLIINNPPPPKCGFGPKALRKGCV